MKIGTRLFAGFGISQLAHSAETSAEQGGAVVGQAGTTMEEIVANVVKVRQIIAEMSTAATEQADGIAQINAAIVKLDQMTQQNAVLVARCRRSLQQERAGRAAHRGGQRVQTGARCR